MNETDKKQDSYEFKKPANVNDDFDHFMIVKFLLDDFKCNSLTYCNISNNSLIAVFNEFSSTELVSIVFSSYCLTEIYYVQYKN